MITSRRIFVIQSLSGAGMLSALATANPAQAQAAVTEADPQAVALGYQANGTKTDTKKYPNYTSNQSCSGCALYQGKATDSAGSCAVFGNKQVASIGWCSAWTKKA
jgi:adenosylcobinamide amidohydrolase